MKRFAVVATRGRNEWCRNLVVQLNQQNTITVVIDNNIPGEEYDGPGIVRRYEEYDENFNYSRAVNIGLDLIASGQAQGSDWLVACLNDDISIPSGFMDAMDRALDLWDVGLVFPDQDSVLNPGDFWHSPEPGPILNHSYKMPGYAHVAFGPDGFRFDESMKIWYSDNDYEMQARSHAGAGMVGGVRVEHHDANGNFERRPYWQEQAGRDRETFKNKWGFYAWQ